MVGGIAAIDTPTFNADQHTSDILRIFPLEKLMVEHRNMAREIKNLDSDMQQLVYENYNKFITATDTIRTMKHSLDAMETEMQRLQQTASAFRDSLLGGGRRGGLQLGQVLLKPTPAGVALRVLQRRVDLQVARAAVRPRPRLHHAKVES